jgi:quercetin dioxygenase-like cupin family protein
MMAMVEGMEFEIRCLVGAAESAGAVATFAETTKPGMGPPLHRHHHQAELFHIIKGRHRFVMNGTELEAGPGDCVFVPAGAVHTFQNIDADPGVLHYDVFPAGNIEAFFRRLVAGDFDPNDIPGFFHAYGIELAGPPR